MNTTTMGTAAGSGAAALAIVGILTWAAKALHVEIPPDVSNDMVVLITIITHYFVARQRPITIDAKVTKTEPVVAPTTNQAPAVLPASTQPHQIG
jgi:hypothetical protein